VSQNPYLFIVGCARSGTTLLRRIVDAHPHIAIMPPIHWIVSFRKRDARQTAGGIVTKETVSALLEHRRFVQLEVSPAQFEGLIGPDETPSYADFLARIFGLYAQVKGKSLVGNKTPVYVRRISTLHTLWPKARFVHLIRDGRDVCLSVTNWSKAAPIAARYSTWTKDPVSTIALWWKQKVQQGREAGSSLGPELYYEIRYESLVTNPAEECKALCAFLALPYDDAMLRFYEEQTKTEPDLEAEHPWLPITPGLRDWRTQMAAEDVQRFEAVTGDLLEELQYPRAVRCPQPEAQRHAASIQKIFIQDARSRRARTLPKGW
jgi:hypothetical protein